MPPTATTTNLETIATRIPIRRSIGSNTSFDSASLDGHSLFSSDDTAMSKRPTVVNSRENGVALVSERKRSTTPKGNKNNGVEGQRGSSPAIGTERKIDKRSAGTDARVPATSTSSQSNKSGVKTPSGSSHKKTHSSSHTRDSERSPPAPKPKNRSKTLPKSQPSIMMSMSALIEQNEDSVLHYSMPKSSVLVSSNRARSNSTPKDTPPPISNPSPQPRRKTNPARTDLSRRRSRSLENFDRALHSESPTPTPTQPDQTLSPPPTRTASRSRHTSSSSRPNSQGKTGYTSSPLSKTTHSRSPTSPDAFAELSVGFGSDGQLHLTKNGASQNTMTTVELTRGFSPRSVAVNGGDSKGKAKAVESPFSIMNTRTPPSYVSEGCVLVQVWAVGLDLVDARLCGVTGTPGSSLLPSGEGRDRNELGYGKRSLSDAKPSRPGGLIRSLSLSRRKTKEETLAPPMGTTKSGSVSGLKQPELGYTPGRSFVGRVVEVGDMDDREMGFRKGDWVIGLLELRKSGALQEYIIVDRRRVLRVPPPSLTDLTIKTSNIPTPSTTPSRSRSRATSTASVPTIKPTEPPQLTIDELALLPLCGVQAYRALRTLKIDSSNNTKPNMLKARRILILNGHDGIGALATQMLAKRGWKVVVHAPCSEDPDLVAQIKGWGGDAVVFDGGEGPVKMMERLIEEGDVNSSIDAILDTLGGKDVWETGEKLLKAQGQTPSLGGSRQQLQQESSLEGGGAAVGSTTSFPPPPPAPPVLQSTSSLSRRFGSIRRRNTGSSTYSVNAISAGGNVGNGGGSSKQLKQFTTTVGDYPDRPVPSASDHFKSGLRSMRKSGVDYTWVNLAQDIDFEGGDVRDALKRVIWMAFEEGVRPALGTGGTGVGRVVGLEKTPEVFVPGGENQRGLLSGSTVVVRVVE